MNVAPPGSVITEEGAQASRGYVAWSSLVASYLTALMGSGTTANRPTKLLWAGRPYFDTTLGQPIWYDGAGWIDATGASA